jgi:hypothetical protein
MSAPDPLNHEAGKQLNDYLLELRLPAIRRSFGEKARRAEAETLSHHFHKYTHVLLSLKNMLTYGMLSGGVHIAAIKPVLYRFICAGKARAAPPVREIYVTVF